MSLTSVLKNCGLVDKYPYINDNLQECAEYMSEMRSGRSDSWRTIKVILNRFYKYARNQDGFVQKGDVYIKLPIDEYLDTICTGQKYKYRVYCRHDINDFAETKYVENFCGKSIGQILPYFSYLRYNHYMLYYLKKYPTVCDVFSKLLDIDLVMLLSKIFARLEFAMENNLTPRMFKKLWQFYGGACSYFGFFLSRTLHTFDKNINIDDLLDSSDINARIEQSLYVMNDPDYNTLMKNTLKNLCESSKQIYELFVAMDVTQMTLFIKNNLDWDVHIGQLVKRNVTKRTLLRCIIQWADLYMVHLIPKVKNETQIMEENAPLANLVLPEKITNNKMVIVEL